MEGNIKESSQKVRPKDKEIEYIGDPTNQKIKISIRGNLKQREVLERENGNKKKEIIKELIQENLPDWGIRAFSLKDPLSA